MNYVNTFLPGLVSILTISISLLGSYYISSVQTMRNVNVDRLAQLRKEFAKFNGTATHIIINHNNGKENDLKDFAILSYSLITLLDYDNKEHTILRGKIKDVVGGIADHIEGKALPIPMRTLMDEVGQQFDKVVKLETIKISKSFRGFRK